jgi:hypothetical protein
MSRDSSRGDQGFNFQMRERGREDAYERKKTGKRGREREEKMQRQMRKKEDGEEREK